MKEITNGQKKIIWTIVRTHGISEEDFRDWLAREFETRSTKKLSGEEAEEVIRCLKNYTGEEYTKHTYTWGITQKQIWRAKRMAGELGWEEQKRLDGLVKKMFGKPRLELLNKQEGTKLIIALEKIKMDSRPLFRGDDKKSCIKTINSNK